MRQDDTFPSNRNPRQNSLNNRNSQQNQNILNNNGNNFNNKRNNTNLNNKNRPNNNIPNANTQFDNSVKNTNANQNRNPQYNNPVINDGYNQNRDSLYNNPVLNDGYNQKRNAQFDSSVKNDSYNQYRDSLYNNPVLIGGYNQKRNAQFNNSVKNDGYNQNRDSLYNSPVFNDDYNKNLNTSFQQEDNFNNSNNSSESSSSKRAGKEGNPIKQKKPTKPIKHKKLKIAAFIFADVVCLLIIIGVSIFNHFFGKMNRNIIDDTNSALGISDNRQSDDEIINIALYGVDSRDNNFAGLSDVVMVVTIDKKRNVIKITSIARDTCVTNRQENSTRKITEMYSKFKVEGALFTLNSNFDLDIRDYVTVNMFAVADTINAVGGVNVDVSEAERKELNKIMCEVTPNSPKLYKTGSQIKLTGEQAVAYSRIRYRVGDENGDIVRGSRQREVLESLFNTAKSMGITKVVSLINTLLPKIETNLEQSEIIELAGVLSSDLKLKQFGFPHENSEYNFVNIYPDKQASNVIKYDDLDVVAKELNDYIYNDIDPSVDKPESSTLQN